MVSSGLDRRPSPGSKEPGGFYGKVSGERYGNKHARRKRLQVREGDCVWGLAELQGMKSKRFRINFNKENAAGSFV